MGFSKGYNARLRGMECGERQDTSVGHVLHFPVPQQYMATKSTLISINPRVLKWARETAGYNKAEAARRIGVPIERLTDWESAPKDALLTPRQLEELAWYYRRPSAALFLAERPSDEPPPRDFRRVLHREAPFSHYLNLAIRRGRRLQRTTAELMQLTETSLTPVISRAHVTDDPEAIASQQREAWGTSWEKQLGWDDPKDALWAWRDSIEQRRIPVFEAEIPREEAQGFSLDDNYPYVVVLSTKDAPTAKCFTLFHEYAHLLLREGGICITQESPAQNGDGMVQTELWCHRFAEAFLVGAAALEAQSEISMIIRQEPTYETALRRLASSFKVSQQVILFRLWHMNLLPEKRFWQEFNRVKEEGRLAEQEAEQKKQSKGGPSPAIKAIHERGRMFTRMVLDGLDREMIGNTDAINYLGIGLKHLEKLRAEASR